MKLRDLNYVTKRAETRHLGKAAERCFVSQPTLSGQVRQLEEELGLVIFERTNRSVWVTPIGEEILAHARQITEQAAAIARLARAHHDPLAGPLHIGAILTLSPYLMPLILLPLKTQLPQIKPILSEEITDVLLERLNGHGIDAALLATPAEGADLETLPLFDEPFWVAYPREHAFHSREQIGRRDLDNENVLLLAEGHCLTQQAMDLCQITERQNQSEMADLRAAGLETLIQVVGVGLGITIALPKHNLARI